MTERVSTRSLISRATPEATILDQLDAARATGGGVVMTAEALRALDGELGAWIKRMNEQLEEAIETCQRGDAALDQASHSITAMSEQVLWVATNIERLRRIVGRLGWIVVLLSILAAWGWLR